MSLKWQGSEFQALAAAAGNTRSPSVKRRVVGSRHQQSWRVLYHDFSLSSKYTGLHTTVDILVHSQCKYVRHSSTCFKSADCDKWLWELFFNTNCTNEYFEHRLNVIHSARAEDFKTNLRPILHRFQVMADYWSNFCYRHGSASL